MTSRDTKKRITDAALRFFSKQGFDATKTRQISDAVGIQPGSLYSHFSSKEDILSEIYADYYRELAKILPDMDAILMRAKTEDLRTLLTSTQYYFNPIIAERMDMTVTAAALSCSQHQPSAEFLKRVLFDIPGGILRDLLSKLIALGRIEPFDAEAYIIVYTSFCHSTAIRNYSDDPISFIEWQASNALLWQMIVPTGR
jgi:AcrR family transcriptional regulator